VEDLPSGAAGERTARSVNPIARWRATAQRLEREVYALYLACRDPRTPWYAKALAAGIVAYAFSPIDLIPDFIPILGYLDELVLLPLGVLLVRRMIAEPVMAECRARAQEAFLHGRPVSRAGAAIVLGVWLVLALTGIVLAGRYLWPPR
jgi:uncharacterized membrane protein YkvA (DUF1232 family)